MNEIIGIIDGFFDTFLLLLEVTLSSFPESPSSSPILSPSSIQFQSTTRKEDYGRRLCLREIQLRIVQDIVLQNGICNLQYI
jgi:hypothetical protein